MIPLRAADAETLEALCRVLIERTNEAAQRTDRQEDGILQPSGDPRQILQGAVTAWSALGEREPALASQPYGPPKAVMASVGLCYANITGHLHSLHHGSERQYHDACLPFALHRRT